MGGMIDRCARAIARRLAKMDHGNHYEGFESGHYESGKDLAEICFHEAMNVTEGMTEAGARGIDEYYNGTKDAPFEGSVAACFRAMIQSELDSRVARSP